MLERMGFGSHERIFSEIRDAAKTLERFGKSLQCNIVYHWPIEACIMTRGTVLSFSDS